MAAPLPPRGWNVELLGLIGAVQFSNSNDSRRLVWCDGEWSHERLTNDGCRFVTPAPGVGDADTMQEARAQGCAFLHRVENEAA